MSGTVVIARRLRDGQAYLQRHGKDGGDVVLASKDRRVQKIVELTRGYPHAWLVVVLGDNADTESQLDVVEDPAHLAALVRTGIRMIYDGLEMNT